MNSTEYDLDNSSLELNFTVSPLFWPSRGSWPSVNKQAKWWLLLHSYGFAVSFLILSFYSFFSILNIRSLMTSRPFMSSINVFLCTLSSSRAVLMFIDPYALKDVMPKLLSFAVWDIGFPSLISAVAFLQLALLHLTQLSVGPKILKNKSCISLIITMHFTCVLAVDILLGLYTKVQVGKYIVDTAFNLWGIMVSLLCLQSSLKAIQLLNQMPSAVLEREIDAQYKGIMQLAMLAPYNNFATSVAAALMPTILAPKFVPKQVNLKRGADLDDVKSSPGSSGEKSEPMKSCILRNSPKPSPNSSDSEDVKMGDGGMKRTKKLSWGPERRVSGQTTKRGQKELETEEAQASLLPNTKAEPDLTLDAILNHIAYMNRGGVSETTLTRKQRLKGILKLTAATPILVLLVIGANFIRMIAPKAWYSNCKAWLVYETFCRGLEVIIAWSVANLTKQPVSNRNSGYTGHVSSKQSMFM